MVATVIPAPKSSPGPSIKQEAPAQAGPAAPSLTDGRHSPESAYFPPVKPEMAYIEGDPSFRQSLAVFLSTFFRLFEQSRVAALALYDESAVFSNALAGQRCKASGVTKLYGHNDILMSMSRLPALVHDPLSSFVIDAFDFGPTADNALCVIKGSFVEFPTRVQRSFDRTLVLKQADESTAAFQRGVGWIILSDLLIVRKFAASTMSSSTGNMIDSEGPSIDAPVVPPSAAPSAPGPTLSESSSDDAADPTPPPDDEAGEPDLSLLAGQIAALKSEVELLKASRFDAPAVVERVGSALARRRPQAESSGARPVWSRDKDQVTRSTQGLPSSSRLLLRAADFNCHVGVGARGEVFAAYDPSSRAGEHGDDSIELLKARPSIMHTHKVDAAVLHREKLILGYYGDTSSPPAAQVTISRIQPTRSGRVTIDREPLSPRPHKRGVLSLCLLPDEGNSLCFASGGNGSKVALWTVNDTFASCSELVTPHTNAVQSIVWQNPRGWLVTAGADRRVRTADKHTFESYLMSFGQLVAHALEGHARVLEMKMTGRCNQIVTKSD